MSFADERFQCPVCGFNGLFEAPELPSRGASYEICPSCDFEFGFSDDAEGFSYEQWRARWLSLGMPWSSSSPRPEGWDPRAQLASLNLS